MAATKTEAFVLKTQDYRDTSLLATFYTPDYGKVKGIIKGVRDTRARYGSMLEPFSRNEILFYRRKRGGDLHQVTQVDVLEMYAAVREDLEKLAYASYMTELVDAMTETEDPNPDIFFLLKDAMVFLQSGASARRAGRIFEWKLLELVGHKPEIHQCVVCRSALNEDALFSVSLGGMRCKNCSRESAGIPVSRGTLNFLDHVERSSFAAMEQIKVAQEVGEALEKMLRRFVDFHLPGKLKSLTFMEKMGY